MLRVRPGAADGGPAGGLEADSRRSAHRGALRLALAYAAVAAAWIVLSDAGLEALALPEPLELWLSSTKGLLFVLVTALVLFVFIRAQFRSVYNATERYRRLFANTSTGLLLFEVFRRGDGSLDLVVDDANPAMLAHLGLERRGVVGRRVLGRDGMPDELRAYAAHVRAVVADGADPRFEVHSADSGRDTIGTAFRIEGGLWAIRMTDITEIRQAEQALRRQDERIRQAYVDVLDAVTGGKLVLMSDDEIAAELGEPLGPSGELHEAAELSRARDDVRRAVSSRFPHATDCSAILSGLGEALNNTLKHAQRGEYQVFAKEDLVQVVIRDHGPGIDFRNLPRAALVPGYSTTATLGMGFTIMLQLSSRLLLDTGPQGTTLVLEVVPSECGEPVPA